MWGMRILAALLLGIFSVGSSAVLSLHTRCTGKNSTQLGRSLRIPAQPLKAALFSITGTRHFLITRCGF